jgi:hypothetical protein
MEAPNLSTKKDPPERLYHYTSIEGLKGILESRCLWASQIHFLNDTQEFRYSIEILKKLISKFKDELPKQRAIRTPPYKPEEWLSDFFGLTEDMFRIDAVSKLPVCVFSFSEDGDLLSQWRAYCPTGGGYSIGFRLESMVPWLQTKKLSIVPCVYDEREQETIIRDEIIKKRDTLLKRLAGEPNNSGEILREVWLEFFMEFSLIASKLKHPAFREEFEWRIISEPLDNEQMSFRVGKSMILPYLTINFTKMRPFPIDEIIVGPGREQHLARFSLLQFLIKKKLKDIPIRESSTPYRELM